MGVWQGTAYSVACVVLGAGALLASRSANVSLRRIAAAGLLLALLVTAVTIPLPTRLGERDWMGDYGLYTTNRRQFEQYTGHDVVFLPSHLSSVLVGRFDRLLGSYPDSPPRAFLVLSWLGTVMFVAELLIVATLNGWSKQALRYIGLCLSAPATVSFLGYREFGQLSLSPAAYPLLLWGLRRSAGTPSGSVLGSAVLQGFRSALHSFGLLGVLGSLSVVLTERTPWHRRFILSMCIAGLALSSAFVWLLVCLVVLRVPMALGHAGAVSLRHSVESYVAGGRVVDAIASWRGARDLAVTLMIVGAPLLVLAPLSGGADTSERRWAPILFAIPSVAWLVLFWPVQGVAAEMDLLFASFPAFYACAWHCARSPRTSALAAACLVAAHVVLWYVLPNATFLNPKLWE